MLRTRRLAVAAFSLGCLFAFGAWLCEGMLWLHLRELVMQLPGTCLFAGRNERIAELLIGNSIGAFSICFGFVIEYLGQRKEIENELVDVYLYLKRTCFAKIFCEQNAYDDKEEEVSDLFEYISGKIYLVNNYKSKRRRNKIFDFFRHIRKKDIDENELNDYHYETVYSLITKVISSLYHYFSFISFNQLAIREAEKGMEICLNEINSPHIDEFEKKSFQSYYVLIKRTRDAYMNRLISRYPENSKSGCFFMDKAGLYEIITEINWELAWDGKAHKCDWMYLLFREHFIVKDKEILYDHTDEEIDTGASVSLEDVKDEFISMGIAYE